jgi:hypothetical protein
MDLLLEAFTAPPPSVLERVLKDLFYAGTLPLWNFLLSRFCQEQDIRKKYFCELEIKRHLC